jgi:hypothetical protein
MVEKGLTTLVIGTPLGTLSWDNAALSAIYEEETEEVEFIMFIEDVSELDDSLQELVGDSVLFGIKVLLDGAPVGNFGTGTVTISLDFALQPGQSSYGIRMYHLSAGGELTGIDSRYSPLGFITFTRSSLSWFVVRYDAAAAIWAGNPFNDVSIEDWFHDAVRYFFERDIIGGTTASTFSPGWTLTRGMAVTLMHRLEGSPEAEGAAPFTDVPADRYYAEAVAWAAGIDLVGGYGDGRFGPEDFITRQDMAVLVARYARHAGIEVPVLRSYVSFNDAGSIAGYAAGDVERAFRARIIDGKGDGMFDPEGNATRAEFAVLMRRFIG